MLASPARESLKAYSTSPLRSVSVATESMAAGLPYSAVTLGVPTEVPSVCLCSHVC